MPIGDTVRLADRLDTAMLPNPLPVTLIFREITLEEAAALLTTKGRSNTMVESPAAAYVLSSRLGMTILASRGRYPLRSYESLIVAEMKLPTLKKGEFINKVLTVEEIARVPIRLLLLEIVEISPQSL